MASQYDGNLEVSFGTYNLFNLYASEDSADVARYERLHGVIRDLDVDVLAVQEIIGKHRDDGERAKLARHGLERLAEAVGMNCERLPGKPAVAEAVTGFHTGLLWRDGIEPVAEKWGNFGRNPGGLWHSMAALVLDIGGTRVRFASYQGDPFNPTQRMMDSYQVLRVMTDDDIPGVIGMDANGMSAARVPVPWSQRWRRPWKTTDFFDRDVYRDVEWFPRIGNQLLVTERGRKVDRRASELLESPRFGRLTDCAVLASAPWEPTTGHWPGDSHPPRRTVRILATPHFSRANGVADFRTVRTESALAASDHVPVVARFTIR